jgi:hypothetical protein
MVIRHHKPCRRDQRRRAPRDSECPESRSFEPRLIYLQAVLLLPVIDGGLLEGPHFPAIEPPGPYRIQAGLLPCGSERNRPGNRPPIYRCRSIVCRSSRSGRAAPGRGDEQCQDQGEAAECSQSLLVHVD